MKRVQTGSWRADCKRGQWYAADDRTGRRIKARDRGHAAQLARDNNTRELTGMCRVPAALVWGGSDELTRNFS